MKESEKKTAYSEMKKKWKARLAEKAMAAEPYDYGFGVELLGEFLKYMLEFYRLGANVSQSEEDRAKTIRSLTEAVKEYDAFENALGLREEAEHFDRLMDLLKERMREWWD